MQIKIFTLRFSPSLGGFDDEPIRAFMADKQIVSFENRFFIKDNVPYWAVLLLYEPDAVPAGPHATSISQDRPGEDYRSILTDESTPLFNLLRDWRKDRALKDGVPKYVVFTNKQLAEVASRCPDTLDQLSSIEGIGKAKIEKYGREVLQIVRSRRGNQKAPVQKEMFEKEGKALNKPAVQREKAADTLTGSENKPESKDNHES